MATAPYSGEAVLAKGKELARRFRAARAPVLPVNVPLSLDFSDALKLPVDRPPALPPDRLPESWTELADGLAEPSDLRITKRQWGAFHGTELDLQLRRRGVTSVVIGGIATNIGVGSTARAGHENRYAGVLPEDAPARRSAETDDFSVWADFPDLGGWAKAHE